jgi:hypothetical protein
VPALASRLALAIAVLALMAYDMTLFALKRLRGEASGAVIERRNRQRGFLDVNASMQVLQKLHQTAERTGAKIFLVSGTLLGMHREGKLLAHDYDIDVGIYRDDPQLSRFHAAMLETEGLRKHTKTRINATECRLNPWLDAKPGDVLLYKYFFRSPTTGEDYGIDLFVHHRVGSYDVHGNFRSFWINQSMSLVSRAYGSVEFLVPEDTLLYLRENYGDFETEKRNFESAVDCPNAANIYGFRGLAWLTGKYAYFLTTREPEKRRIIGRRIWDYLRYGLFLQSMPRWRMNQYDPAKLDSTRPSQ